MTENKIPIKRHDALKPLSRDHHHALLLIWKIRRGLKTNISLLRIEKYICWFYQEYIKQHFIDEEWCVFAVTGISENLLATFKNEHARLRLLFQQEIHTTESLTELADLLESHIRFEERVLFNEVQLKATASQLTDMQAAHREKKFIENNSDEFWR